MIQERLNQKEFAATTGISPATLSSIFNGRTSPTLNHAEALHRRFPKLNMSWLMFGEGSMYVGEKSGPNMVDDLDGPEFGKQASLFDENNSMDGLGDGIKGGEAECQLQQSGDRP